MAATLWSRLPITLSIVGILLSRRKSVRFRVALGLGLGVFVPPMLTFALLLAAFLGKGGSL